MAYQSRLLCALKLWAPSSALRGYRKVRCLTVVLIWGYARPESVLILEWFCLRREAGFTFGCHLRLAPNSGGQIINCLAVACIPIIQYIFM